MSRDTQKSRKGMRCLKIIVVVLMNRPAASPALFNALC
jgi:hypothetical protein